MNLFGYSVLLMLWGYCRAQAPCGRPESRNKEEPAVALIEEYKDQTILTYNCQPGYRKLGRIQYKCNNGEWQRITHVQCTEKPCGNPGDMENGKYHITKATEFVFGARVEYTCDEGYQMISRLSYRDCTATGWSNSVPSCEARKCIPFIAPNGGRIIATGTHQIDDEASVGHVLRFECNSPTAKPVPNEVYCTMDGEWSAERVECKEITCPRPNIQHGIIRNKNNVFKKDERLDFECENGYKSEGRTPECTENGWNPDPACKVIICLSQIVSHGQIMPKRDSYMEGEIVELRCDDGFKAKYSHNARPKCTASGWVPPLLCESETCDYRKIENGRYYWSSYDRSPYYYFPMSNGKQVSYICNEGFATSSGSPYGEMECTSNGWSPAPKCLRTCAQLYFSDMDILYYERSVYTVGTTVSYKCHKGYTNPEGNESGAMDCLPDGQFSEPKCTRSCIVPSASLKNHKPNKKVVHVNEMLQYECEDGFKSQRNNLVEQVSCAWYGWSETPQCTEIKCSLSQTELSRYGLSSRSRNFKDGDVVKFDCKEGKVKGAEKAQCYYFGWYPEPPLCAEEFDPDSSKGDGADVALGSVEECPQPPILVNTVEETIKRTYYNDDTVTYTCKTNYILHGSNTITCQNGRWTSPPQCIERKQCNRPPYISNAQILVSGSPHRFYSGDRATYVCNAGYRLRGSNESMCIGGRWQTAPMCIESPCDQAPPIEFGSIVDGRAHYAHGSTVQVKCDSGYKQSSPMPTQCVMGTWRNVPQCISTECGAAPRVQNANIRGSEKQSYRSGEAINYQCEPGFDFERTSYATCHEGQWTNPPVCKKIGERCGPAPPLANGDVEGTQQPFFNTGASVKYKCQHFHIMDGSATVTCKNGAWTALPDCLEPCTASAEEMAANNLQLRYLDQSKLYSKHGDITEFSCINDYKKVETLEFRVKCNRGKLTYPKCISHGSCVASDSEMEAKNIILQRENVDIRQGETAVFACKPGFFQKPDQNMGVICRGGKLNYPECVNSPPDCSGPPSIEHGSVTGAPKQAYHPDVIVEYTCDADYALEGNHKLKCIGGGWSSDAPKCIGPCKLSKTEMNRNNLELNLKDSVNKPVKHKTFIDFKCKEGYIELPPSLLSTGQCINGIITYPSCIEDSPCQVTAEKQEEHGVELKRKSGDTTVFKEGATIEFACKSGFKTPTAKSLIVRCTADGFEYPTCISTVPCRLTQEDMDENNLELHEKHNDAVTYQNGQNIDFKCKAGFSAKTPLSGTCNQRRITYPTCVPPDGCILSQEKMAEYSIQLQAENEKRRYAEMREKIIFHCKGGFKKHPGSGELIQECIDGVIVYPRCIHPGTSV